MAGPPDMPSLTKLKTFLSRGRRDYDWVASRVYAACYNDENVLQKILAANPEDAPSSDEESYPTSEDEYADIDEEYDWDSDENDEDDELAKQIGSKDDPVVLEEESKPDKSKKRKRLVSKKEDKATEKKPKHSDKKVLCVNCGSKFDPNKNKEGECRYHPSETILGELEMNPTDDQISDDEDSRETWPNAFLWECCETNFEETDAEPCESGTHSAKGDQTEYSRRKETERKHTKYYG